MLTPTRLQQEVKRPRRQLTISNKVIPAPLQVVIVLTNSQHIIEAFAQEYTQLQKLNTRTVTILDLHPRHGLSDSVVFQPLYLKEDFDNLIASAFLIDAYPPQMLRSTTTYLVCLSRPLEHILPYKHAIYDTYIVIFGKPSCLREYHFEVTQCPICEERSDITFTLAFNLTTDSFYNSEGLSKILKAAVNLSCCIFDIATANPTGCRIAIIVSCISNSKAYILANYRGISPRSTNTAYEFLTLYNNRQDPSLLNAVYTNTLLGITLRESSIIWPMAKRHDLLLSIGTGFSISPPSRPTDRKQGFLEALNYLPYLLTPNIFRLDQVIDRTLPRLDNIYSLEAMLDIDFTVPAELIRTILALVIFFFKLDKTPIQGSIDLVDIYRFYRYFRKRINFWVTSLNEMVTIEIANNTFRERISGFPKSA
ncbi:unnamed protein product [Penicillium roqueforti FM164]|uniref:Genomic scaffold, ProqFM164S02 n=1 Tax=Penicillium roqueforti (strain FM164) TaxID=1365484 RepID=W6QSV7_PENRF|nr:unnamed protein product [Penicillium roqueforti FM164]